MARENLINKIHEYITRPKIVKISTIIAFIVAFSALIIGYIIAQFGPHGYNMIDNYISDMGSIKYTPFPYMRTIGNVISSPFFIPITFYIKSRLASKELSDISPLQLRLGSIGFIGMLTIFMGMFCTGIITEDVNNLIHTIISIIAIIGGTISMISYGLLIVKFPTDINEFMGVLMIIDVPIIAVLAIIGFPSVKFYEWMLLLSFYGLLIINSIVLIKTNS